MKVKEIMRFMADMTLRTGFPVPVPQGFSYKWAEGYGFNRKGEVMLYTGALYQLVPYIESLSAFLKSIERSDIGAFLALRTASHLPAGLLVNFLPGPDKKLVDFSNKTLRSIAGLLIKNGIEFSYLYEDDIYSGVLLYDMGLVEEFGEHAKKVYSRLKGRGVKKVITVDPHTYSILAKTYPKFIDGFSLEVVSYMELIKKVTKKAAINSLTIHDSCIYARELNIIDAPRKLLEGAGYSIVEPRRNREYTFCCGGPVEMLSPSLASAIADDRMKELSEKSKNIVTMCPICFINFYRIKHRYKGVEIYDISSLI
ncbi:MAG: (Fe-S)-binding protein [Caldisphaeraceae archaeon]|nr:(Fe-S)-binding protein [Caldisphaeraceae archaeon]